MLTNVINHNFRFHNERNDDVEDRESMIIQYDKYENTDDEIDSSEVNSSSNASSFEDFNRIGLVEIGEESDEYKILRKTFLRTIGTYATDTKVLGIHKNAVVDPVMKARKEAFKIFEQAIAAKCGGNPNIWLGWYSCSTEEICRIISYGFSSETSSGESHGVGIHLSSAKFPLDSSVKSLAIDSNGVSHMLLCRVIMGKMEPIPLGSNQIQPSSTEFDSGVDNLTAPRRLTVWSAFMNSHIFPTYVISFKRPPSFNGRTQVRTSIPSSPWMSFPMLMDILSKRLDPSKMALISKSFDDFRNHQLSRQKMIQKLRQLTGDRLLVEIIKSCKHKVLSSRQSKTSQQKKTAPLQPST
ncbi:probable inactive poly [ADP-ribose] polymerase SRO2 isoform X2 [Euphorbia lathyris]|uniref:probable inactive poly [ADP-ribose] polymerase SRO2 isoform X2 n=1 Tax=Euphorbia lathyris TaxID=212925 RepID=UPI0033140F15